MTKLKAITHWWEAETMLEKMLDSEVTELVVFAEEFRIRHDDGTILSTWILRYAGRYQRNDLFVRIARDFGNVQRQRSDKLWCCADFSDFDIDKLPWQDNFYRFLARPKHFFFEWLVQCLDKDYCRLLSEETPGNR